ncbi:MAG TPA: YqgE/AlgH family protein [Acidimicrobiales bacterium]|nr:YqgE/AlgH family protein [Acidimicrobiales bacterium]
MRGRLLLAGPNLIDPNFFRTVVLLLEHNDEGAVGVVLNRPTELPVREALPPWAGAVSEPPVVFVGGPVAAGTALALGHNPDDDDAIIGDIAVVDLESPSSDWDQVRIFSGYSGWGAGQLEHELAQEAWLVLDAAPDDVRSTDPDDLWAAVLRRQHGPLALLASYPDEPAFN